MIFKSLRIIILYFFIKHTYHKIIKHLMVCILNILTLKYDISYHDVRFVRGFSTLLLYIISSHTISQVHIYEYYFIPFKIGLRPPIIMTNPNYHHHHLHRFYYSHYFFLYVLHYYVSIYLNFHHKTMLYMYLKLDGDVYLI